MTMTDILEKDVGPAPATDNGAIADASAAEVREKIIRILSLKKLDRVQKYTRIAVEVTRCLQRRGRFYFHAEHRDFDTAMFFDKVEKILTPVRDDRFTGWLSLWTATNRADPLFKYLRTEVENVALSPDESSGIIPERFWARRDDVIYVSCGDGQLVKITGKETKLADNGTDDVLFPYGSTLIPWELTAPRDPFETCSLFRDIACTATHGPDLIRLFVLSLFTNPRSKPPLVASGEIGSGKTRMAKGIAELLGIIERVSKVEEAKESDFWAAIDQGGVLILDNADTKVTWLADAIANAATDGCKIARRLYTNSETVIQRARSWLVITSATPMFASDAGLADRLLVVRMKRRQGDTADSQLSEEIAAHRDSGLSFIAHTLSKALADKREPPTALNSRHPDFASFGARIGRAIGREAEIIAALQAAEADKARFCLENDYVGAALLATINQEAFKGSAAQLLERIRAVDPELEKLTAKKLGKKLTTHWAHIEGVFQASKRVAHGGAYEYELRAR